MKTSAPSGWTLLSLFGSFSTLLCCALPAFLVALGAGATLAHFLSYVPQLIWISEHKGFVFVMAAVMLVLAGASQWRARRLPCPLDPVQAKACARTRLWSRAIYFFSLTLYAVGATFAFLLS